MIRTVIRENRLKRCNMVLNDLSFVDQKFVLVLERGKLYLSLLSVLSKQRNSIRQLDELSIFPWFKGSSGDFLQQLETISVCIYKTSWFIFAPKLIACYKFCVSGLLLYFLCIAMNITFQINIQCFIIVSTRQ